MTEEKKKVATVCLGGCSGCHMSFLDLDEYVIELMEHVDIEASHVIVDEKEIPDVDIGIVEGAVSTETDVETIKKLRENCGLLLAWGDCACLGGITTMRNFYDRDELLRECYEEKTDSESAVPSSNSIPELLEKAGPVNQFVEVDAHLPGCPPPEDVIKYGFEKLLEGETPVPRGKKLQYD